MERAWLYKVLSVPCGGERNIGQEPTYTLQPIAEIVPGMPATHQHTDACYTPIPETEGTGNYLSCGKVAGEA